MLTKPDTCKPCPLYRDGRGFVPDRAVQGAALLVLAQNPGDSEEQGLEVTGYQGKSPLTKPCDPQPLVGPTGYTMTKRFLPLTGLLREEVSLCNVLRCRLQDPQAVTPSNPQGRVNTMPTGKVLEEAVRHCSQYLHIPESTRLIIAQGAHAWGYLGGPGKVMAWRGHLSPTPHNGIPVLATTHLADLRHNPWMSLICQMDWKKAGDFLRGVPVEQPDLPPHRVLNEMAGWEVCEWFDHAEAEQYIVVDTEYNPATRQLYLLGLGMPPTTAYHLPLIQYMWFQPADVERWALIDRFRALINKVPIIMFNALADVPVLRAAGMADWPDFIRIEDPMQAHSILWCEMPHDLEFVGSLYSPYPKTKHLMKADISRYNAGDLADTGAVWDRLRDELEKDPQSAAIYEAHIALLPHVDESMQRGIAVDASKVEPAAASYREKMAEGQKIAQAYTGYPINLNSPQQMQRWLYGVEGFKTIKHPKTKRPTTEEAAIVVMRNKYLAVDPHEEPTPQGTMSRIAAGGHPLLEALVLYGTAEHAMSHYIKPLYNEGGTVKARIYHSVAIHTQANARWSWTDPPLAQLPKDLRNLFMPDPGWPWFCFDHDQIELRMVAGYSGDPAMLKAFADGWDVHLLATVAMFDLPPPPTYVNTIHDPACMAWRASVRWKECDHANEVCGKDDIRRHFAKTFGHRQSYGGTAGRSGDIPGAKELGLTPHRLSQMSVMRASLFSGLAKWQNDMVASATRIGETRTWAGRRRRYLSKEYNYLRGEMLDHPMQAGVQDLENAIILEVKEKFGSDVYIVYGMHDSQKWGVREERWDEITEGIREIATRPRMVNGRLLEFPASFSERWA